MCFSNKYKIALATDENNITYEYNILMQFDSLTRVCIEC